MALPTSEELKARHPAFVSVNDTYIDAVIQDASGFVDPNLWVERDINPAIMALACHMMATEGALGGNPSSSGVLTSDKLGDAAQTYGAVATNTGDYGTTSYGRIFKRLQRVNVPGVATT